jgi:hypothetical protein
MLLDLFCIVASHYQTYGKRVNGNEAKKKYEESNIGAKEQRKVAISRTGQGWRYS